MPASRVDPADLFHLFLSCSCATLVIFFTEQLPAPDFLFILSSIRDAAHPLPTDSCFCVPSCPLLLYIDSYLPWLVSQLIRQSTINSTLLHLTTSDPVV